jgi:hypothetical protein
MPAHAPARAAPVGATARLPPVPFARILDAGQPHITDFGGAYRYKPDMIMAKIP